MGATFALSLSLSLFLSLSHHPLGMRFIRGPSTPPAGRSEATRWSDEVLRFSPSLMEVVKGWQELLESQLDVAESRFNETIHACGNNAHGIKYTSRSGWQVSDTKADAQK